MLLAFDPWQGVADVEWAIAIVLFAIWYAWAARHFAAPWWRQACFFAGLVLIALALLSPIEHLALHSMLSFHLLQNVMIADWAPPLLLLGLSPAMRASVFRVGGRPLAALTRPRIALPVWLVGWYAIHLALFYDFALRHAWTLNLEHLLLIAIGLIFWWPVLADEPVDIGAPVKIGYLGAAFVGATFLGLGLTFASTPFYDFYADAPRLWGISAERDQNFGGILMNVEQAFVFLAAILYFVVKLIPDEEQMRAS